MITYEQALKKAMKLNTSVNYCTEYTDAYVFSDHNDDSIGGNGPVVILKEDGSAVNMTYYIDSTKGAYQTEFPVEESSSR